LLGHSEKLNDREIEFALKSYLKENKVSYTELIIIQSKEITEQEYIDRTQYV